MQLGQLRIFFLIASLAVAGCNKAGEVSSYIDPDAGKLTNEKAQRAIQRWMNNGTVSVQGIQEVPQENAAKVDITFHDFHWNDRNWGARKYSGPAMAVFTHYNDGRWVLVKLQTSQGFNSTWWDNINVEAR
jgi:hypothetical protein